MEFITDNVTEIFGISFGVFVSVLVLIKSYAKQIKSILGVVGKKSDKVDTDKIEAKVDKLEYISKELLEIMEVDASLKQHSTVVPDEYKKLYNDILEKYKSTNEEE